MKGYNRAIVAGNLVHDPELRYTPGGAAMLSVALAVNSREKRGEEWQDRVDYFDVTLFGKTAENVAHFLRKGSALLVEGRLRQERWDDKETGRKRSRVGIVASEVVFLGAPVAASPRPPVSASVPSAVGGPALSAVEGVSPDAAPVEDGEIPF